MKKGRIKFTDKVPTSLKQPVNIIQNVDVAWLTYRDYGTTRERQYRSSASGCTIIDHGDGYWGRLLIPPQTIWTAEGNQLILDEKEVWRHWKNLFFVPQDKATHYHFKTGLEYLQSTLAQKYES